MNSKILFFEPIFKTKIWGGERLKEFAYDIPSDKTGECWAISAHENGQSIVKNGVHKGKSLGELWENHRELFGNIPGDKFPLLVKIIDANKDLSVQVHPNDEYAQIKENGELGKSECWYILDCIPDTEMVYGINAKDKDELNNMIDKGKWDELLQVIPIKKGDFFYVPSGTVHALKEGTLILEIQQNSDTTYRLYDYDRKDEQGNLRELHIEKSKDVIDLSFVNRQEVPMVQELNGIKKTKFIESPYFTVEKYEVVKKANLVNEHGFILMSIIEGEGVVKLLSDSYPVVKGDHFMLSSYVKNYSIEGFLKIIVSYI